MSRSLGLLDPDGWLCAKIIPVAFNSKALENKFLSEKGRSDTSPFANSS